VVDDQGQHRRRTDFERQLLDVSVRRFEHVAPVLVDADQWIDDPQGNCASSVVIAVHDVCWTTHFPTCPDLPIRRRHSAPHRSR
jgi:hypothetical protein